MPPLPITATAAAILGLIYLFLSTRVIMARGQANASLGDGSGGTIAAGLEHTVPLLVASRTHANFAEYVPMILVLLAIVELQGTRHWIVEALAVLLVLARVMHPMGMGRKVPNPFRAGGAALTFLALLGASVTILVNLAFPA